MNQRLKRIENLRRYVKLVFQLLLQVRVEVKFNSSLVFQ